MKVYLEDNSGAARQSDSLEGISLGDHRLLWVESVAPAAEELERLASFFDIHPVAVMSYGHADHVPKVIEFTDHLFIVWHFLRDDPETDLLESSPVFIFLGADYLLTIHREEMEELEEVFGKLMKDPEIYHHQPAALLYAVLDSAVDGYFPVVEDVTDRVDAFQEEVISSGSASDVHTIMTLKHRNMALRRNASWHRDVLLKLSRHDVPFIPQDLSIYLLDVYDHLVRVGSEVDNNSDLITSSLDINLSMVSNKLNEVMKKLTIVSTIFLPLTFLAGVWGMNFKRMPELFWHHGYLLAWVSLVVVGIATYLIAMRITSDKPRPKGRRK